MKKVNCLFAIGAVHQQRRRSTTLARRSRHGAETRRRAGIPQRQAHRSAARGERRYRTEFSAHCVERWSHCWLLVPAAASIGDRQG